MDGTDEKTTAQPENSCPVIGTSLNKKDFSALTKNVKGVNKKEITKLLNEFSPQAIDTWTLSELASDIQVLHLEKVIEDSLGSNYFEEDDIDVDTGENLMVDYQVITSSEEVPGEIKNFLKSLDKLVRRTQVQLRKYNKNK
jgi:hypothetical protein